MKENGYESYLDEWEAPIHPKCVEELTPLSKQEYDDLNDLTLEEELALEKCLESYEPLSNAEYINLLSNISTSVEAEEV